MVLSLSLAKTHCRVDGNDEDELMLDYIESAVDWVETYTGHALSEKQIVQKFSCFTPQLKLNVEPVRSIESITYLDEDGAEQTFTDFRLWKDCIVPQVGFSWPTALYQSEIEVALTVGYDEDDLPKSLKNAVRLLVGHQYENRESVVVGTIASQLPQGVIAYAHPYRGDRV